MRQVLVVAMKNFNDWDLGTTRWVYMTPGIAHLIVSHYLRLLWDPAWEMDHGQGDDSQAGSAEQDP